MAVTDFTLRGQPNNTHEMILQKVGAYRGAVNPATTTRGYH